MTGARSGACRDKKNRMGGARRSGSPKGDLGGGATPMSGGSGDEGAGSAGPRATLGHGGAL
jgi:hypothetical protein